MSLELFEKQRAEGDSFRNESLRPLLEVAP